MSDCFFARVVGRWQPAQLAAMEVDYQPQSGAPLVIGGIPNDETRTTDDALRIPRALSLRLDYDSTAKVVGLEEFPGNNWPNVRIVH